MPAPAAGQPLARRQIVARMGAAERALLHRRLDAVFVDEDTSRGGWGQLAADCAVVVTGDGTDWTLTCWPVGDWAGTSPDWAAETIDAAIAELAALDSSGEPS